MKKWEYWVLHVDNDHPSQQQWSEDFDYQGEQGWELVSIVRDKWDIIHAVFKRPKQRKKKTQEV